MDVSRCLDDYDPDFKYYRSNDSHSWIINYPNKLKPDPNTLKVSHSNEIYQKPEVIQEAKKGKRKKVMEAFFRKILTEEMFGDLETDYFEIEKYETDYSEHFKNPDDLPFPGEVCSKNEKLRRTGQIQTSEKEISKLEELKSKYPLYLSAPLTYASQLTGRENFRKNSTISKPPDQNFDNIEY